MFFKVKCVIPMPLMSTKGPVASHIRASIAMSDRLVYDDLIASASKIDLMSFQKNLSFYLTF